MSKILPDFSQIVFVPRGTGCSSTQPEELTNLFRVFCAVLNHQALEVQDEQLRKMISQDLNIVVNSIDERLMNVLTEALVYYMRIWPGWQRSTEYYNGELSCTEWFTKFQNYLILKSSSIIKHADKYIAELHNETEGKDVAVQAQVNPGNKKIAPYTLCISGPPSLLNNIVFEESEGNILIKQLKTKPWSSVKLNEFLNWPFVSVSVRLQDISFTRTNTHAFERFVTFRDNLTVQTETSNIRHIKKIFDASEQEMQPYSYEFICSYLQQFYNTLKIILGTRTDRLQELKAIFSEFLYDIKEANVYDCTMCTNTCVGFNIGKCKYIRKNTVRKKTIDENAVDYYEILTPQIDIALNIFRAIQETDGNGKISFRSINSLSNFNQAAMQHFISHINKDSIMYHCTLCSETFCGGSAYQSLREHFIEKHKAERTVECCKCRQKFDINVLAGQRWAHKCT